MKRLLKRWVAFLLSLMIMLHSTFLSVSADDVPLPVEYIDNIISEDICVNPEDYVINSDVSTLSLGVTLTIGQIAALIAGGAGAIYAVSNFDDLGRHLQNALDTAASIVPNGVDVLAQWTAKAINGDIALASAPSWIATTILQVMHGLVTSVSPLIGQPFSGEAAAAVESCKVVPAGSPIYSGVPRIDSMTGEVTRTYWTFSVDVVPIVLTYTTATNAYVWFAVSPVNGESDAVVYRHFYTGSESSYSLWSSSFSRHYITVQATGQTRHFFYINGESMSYDELYEINAFDTYCLPGSFAHNSNFVAQGSFTNYFQKYYDGVLGAPSYDYPEGIPIDPGILVGGLPDVWVGQGLGADVVTMPDINLDGSDLINVGDQTALDTSIGTTMDKLATGELTWDDYWLDISGSGPLVDVGEGEGEDVGPPLQLPDWFKDWCKDITGTELDRNSEIDSLLPDLDEGMGQIDDFSASIGDQLKTEFDALHIENFALSTSVLLAIGWIAGWVTQFFNASGEAQVVVLLPMFIGLALLFIGRGSVAMSRVHSSHQHDTRKAAVTGKKGGGTP